MKYKKGQNLYYVCPFTFSIHEITIAIVLLEGEKHYIDTGGAYLKEQDLFKNLYEAKIDAMEKLNKFYIQKVYEITGETNIEFVEYFIENNNDLYWIQDENEEDFL